MSAWWRDLGKLEGVNSPKQGWLSNGISKKLGCGNSVSFWKESWASPYTLENRFARLFNISTAKDSCSPNRTMDEWFLELETSMETKVIYVGRGAA